MKNFSSTFVSCIILFFTSCAKEAPVIPAGSTDLTIAERSTTVPITIESISYSILSGELTVDFSGEDDFSSVVLENVQYLDFADATSNVSTLTFQVNSYSGSNGELQTVFAVGSNNLAGLILEDAQEIIIEDSTID